MGLGSFGKSTLGRRGLIELWKAPYVLVGSTVSRLRRLVSSQCESARLPRLAPRWNKQLT
jgi:hypothetical protein